MTPPPRSKDDPQRCECCTAIDLHNCSPRLNSHSHLMDEHMTNIEEDFYIELASQTACLDGTNEQFSK
jgi:hypothetical protein